MSGIDKVIGLVTAKAETTYGTDPTPTPAANALYCIEATVTPVWETPAKVRVRDRHPAPGVSIGAAWYEFTIKVPFNGPADPGGGALAGPPCDPLILAARHAKALTGGPPTDTVTYTPSSATAPGSVTLYFYMAPLDGSSNWELIKVTGARCSMKIDAPNGEGYIEFVGKGLYSPPTNVSKPTGTAFVEPNDSLPPRGHTLTFDGRSGDAVTAVSFMQNAEAVPKRDLGGTYGIGSIELYLGQPTIEHDAELVLTSDYDRHAEVDESVTAALSLALNTVGGARYTLAAAEFQHGSFSYDRAADVMRVGATLYPKDTAAGSGDDSYSLTITRP